MKCKKVISHPDSMIKIIGCSHGSTVYGRGAPAKGSPLLSPSRWVIYFGFPICLEKREVL